MGGGANPSVATNEYFKGGETWPVCLEAVEGLVNYIPEEVWAPFTRFYTTDEASTMSSTKTDLDTYMKSGRPTSSPASAAWMTTGTSMLPAREHRPERVHGDLPEGV